MELRLLDLDGSLTEQTVFWPHRPTTVSAAEWGPHIRLACSFRRFRAFERALAERLGGDADDAPAVTFYGSGDFHHVSLALLRRRREPFNLLVLDKHPDWVRGVPFLHCGTWLVHALRLPNLRRVFHVGGGIDFDNHYRPFAPWAELRSGRVVVLPAARRFRGGPWERLPTQPLRAEPLTPADLERIDDLLAPYRADLAHRPLYVSLDKDVLREAEAVVNWDSGGLRLMEVEAVLAAFRRLAGDRLIGMDVLGDWSPVRVSGWLRRLLHLAEHPTLAIDPAHALARNERTNRRLLAALAAPYGVPAAAARGRAAA